MHASITPAAPNLLLHTPAAADAADAVIVMSMTVTKPSTADETGVRMAAAGGGPLHRRIIRAAVVIITDLLWCLLIDDPRAPSGGRSSLQQSMREGVCQSDMREGARGYDNLTLQRRGWICCWLLTVGWLVALKETNRSHSVLSP